MWYKWGLLLLSFYISGRQFQRGSVTGLKSHSWYAAELGYTPAHQAAGFLDSKVMLSSSKPCMCLANRKRRINVN